MILLRLLLCGFLPTLSLGKFLTSPEDLTTTSYDFVIVGGGTAGNVLANRLTGDSRVRVLLIEAGGSNKGITDLTVPFLGVTLPGTSVDWNFTSTPQTGLNSRTIPYARGHVLGGSSSINLLTFNRASNETWDHWANLTDDSGWAWKSVEKYYLKTSRLVASADNHSTTGQVDPSVHGNGPVKVSIAGFPTELDDVVINTSKKLGGRFRFTEDPNAGDFVGFSYVQSSIGGGERSSSATAYLEPVISRNNLDILIETQVTKLIPSDNGEISPVFTTVEVAQNPASRRYRVYATKEVILSAGVFGSPQILLRSGIGPQDALQSIGIHSLVDLADVGQNLADHPLVPVYYSVNSNKTFDAVLRDPALFNQNLEEWNTSRQGLFADPPANTMAFMRLPDNSTIFQSFKDPSSGPLSAHTELIFGDGFAQAGPIVQPAAGNFMTIFTAVTSPTSRGSVTLQSSDPFAKPFINPHLLESEFDTFAIVEAMKDAQEFIEAPLWKDFIIGAFGELANATTDAAKLEYARKNAVTVNHPVGTARMSPTNAKWGVVDSELRVKRVSGLRVVDASIFPVIPECHPQGLVYTVAERAAELIKTTHGLH